jgi:hypothetical protein
LALHASGRKKAGARLVLSSPQAPMNIKPSPKSLHCLALSSKDRPPILANRNLPMRPAPSLMTQLIAALASEACALATPRLIRRLRVVSTDLENNERQAKGVRE